MESKFNSNLDMFLFFFFRARMSLMKVSKALGAKEVVMESLLSWHVSLKKKKKGNRNESKHDNHHNQSYSQVLQTLGCFFSHAIV